MRERWDWAALFAASMVVLRAVGVGGLGDGNEGVTVRAEVDVEAGFVVLLEVVASFAPLLAVVAAGAR